MAYMNGRVKKIPIQQPIKPTKDAIKPTNNNKRRTKGCFRTICKLNRIASIAFKSPKIIRGIVKTVKKEIAIVITKPII